MPDNPRHARQSTSSRRPFCFYVVALHTLQARPTTSCPTIPPCATLHKHITLLKWFAFGHSTAYKGARPAGRHGHVMPDNPRHARPTTSCRTYHVMPDNPRQARQSMRSQPVKPDLPRHARQSPSSPTIHVMPDNPRHARQSTSSPTIHAKPTRQAGHTTSSRTYHVKLLYYHNA